MNIFFFLFLNTHHLISHQVVPTLGDVERAICVCSWFVCLLVRLAVNFLHYLYLIFLRSIPSIKDTVLYAR
uniref:Putative secreted peptide n=1 Tax=Anopheles braziliensis TaxID=58242 RepID=A0A2M3ZND0_9DIPT